MDGVGRGGQPVKLSGLSVPDVHRRQFPRRIHGFKQRLVSHGLLFPYRAAVEKQLYLVGVGIDLHNDGLAFISPEVPAMQGVRPAPAGGRLLFSIMSRVLHGKIGLFPKAPYDLPPV